MLCYVCYVIFRKIWRDILGCEDHIVRTTVYLPHYLHAKGKQLKINFSKEFEIYLKTRFYDDDFQSLEMQLEEAKERVKKLSAELSVWKKRISELEKTIQEHDTRIALEKNEYSNFIRHAKARIEQSEQIGIDYHLLLQFWKKQFFKNNDIDIKFVKRILFLVKIDKFSFETFQKLRRGELCKLIQD